MRASWVTKKRRATVKHVGEECFICLDRSCQGSLREIDRSDYVDGGSCGNGHVTELYECSDCRKRYFRMAFDSHEPFSYKREQEHIHPVVPAAREG